MPDPDHVFVEGVDLREPLEEMRDEGAAFVPKALSDTYCMRLRRELRDGPFEVAPEPKTPVHQDMETFTLQRFALYPAVDALRAALVHRVRCDGEGIRGLKTWWPNEAGVNRYRPGSDGITPHLDESRFRRLVVVLTVRGRARIDLHRERDGAPVRSWSAGPGSLVLLRGPGLGGYRDGRPFHAVGGPGRGVRISLGLRMDSKR